MTALRLPRLSWEARRRLKLAGLWLAFGFVGALLAYALPNIHVPGVKRLSSDEFGKMLEDNFRLRAIFSVIPRLQELLDGHPVIYLLGLGFVGFGGIGGLVLRIWVHDHFFASFNDDVLTRLDDLHRPDADGDRSAFVQLGWRAPKAGSRLEAWKRLAEFTTPRGIRGEVDPRDITVLAGRSGSGKSRMAYELFTRRARGGPLDGDPPKYVMRPIAAYLRRSLPGLAPHEGDPCDVALLDHKAKDTRTLTVSVAISRDGGQGIAHCYYSTTL